jgi:hypothetical protein
MSTNPDETKTRADSWAHPVGRLKVTDQQVPAAGYNIQGRQVASPLQGFGQLWRKTYRIRLTNSQATPFEVMQIWKEHFPRFQPPENHFYPSMAGVKPGELLYITTRLPIWPGSPGIIPFASGVIVLYADDEMFTVMTPEGFPEAGWNTFSAYEEDGVVTAQVQGMVRAADPIYEIGWRFLGGSPKQDQTWIHVLTALATHLGVAGERVELRRECIDPGMQWRYATNVFQNAAIRTVFYVAATPIRSARNRLKSRSGRV